MATISCHSNQSFYPIRTKKQYYLFPLPIDAICEYGKNRLNGFRGDVVWKCWRRRTTDACLYYKLTYQLRWAKNGNLIFWKLLSERSEWEKIEWYWHPESNLIPKCHDFSLIFKFHDFSMHVIFFCHFPCGNPADQTAQVYTVCHS